MFSCKNKQKIIKSETVQVQPQKEVISTVVTENKDKDNTFKIKIIRRSCASDVVQILEEKFFHLGEEWVPYNVRMKEPYKNMATVSKCILPDNIKENDICRVVLTTPDEANKKDCIVCMMMDYPPTKTINIKFIAQLDERLKE
jgi:hypothetical protein